GTRTDDLIWREAFFTPPLESRENITPRIRSRCSGITEIHRADAPGTVSHSRDHKEPIEVFNRFRGIVSCVGILREKGAHVFVIFDRVRWRNRSVRPAVILDKFTAVSSKRSQIGTIRIQNPSDLFLA